MTCYNPSQASLTTLKDQVIVLTGGASGIGAATVQQLYAHGSKVIFGDLDETGAANLVQSTSPSSVHFVKCDVRLYTDNLALFKTALNKYGRVDHAIANAGVVEQKGWFDPRGGIQGVEEEPSSIVLDVNLKGTLNFANIACAYLAHGNDKQRPHDMSLTLLSSVAGFKESPGLFVYEASTAGVLGLMRALRLYVPRVYPGVRVNAVCPSMTMTRMVAGIKKGWVDAGLPVNKPDDIARVLVALCASGPGTRTISYDMAESNVSDNQTAGGSDWNNTDKGVNGRALYVIGGTAVDIEESLDKTEHLWLGKQQSELLTKAQLGLGDGTNWVTDK